MGKLTKYIEAKRENKIKSYIHGIVLDIGCGPAHAINHPNVKKYYGVELLDDVADNLKRKFKRHSFLVKNLETDEISLKEKVDVVIMTAFLEHLNNYENPIKQAVRNLKGDGIIVITTPSKFGNIIHYIGASLGLFSKEARDDHKSILSKRDFQHLANKYNLKLKTFNYFEFFCNQLVVFGR